MAENLQQTPVDAITQLPLPIFVSRADMLLHESDFHHHFHPLRSHELGHIKDDFYRGSVNKDAKTPHSWIPRSVLNGKAVRYSRGQMVPKHLHSLYHGVFKGPPLPRTLHEQFTAVVLACAQIVPRQAIEMLGKDEYQIRDLSNRQHSFISSYKRMFFERSQKDPEVMQQKRAWIGQFFANYAIDRSLSEIIDSDVIDEFLTARVERRHELGRMMLMEAIDASVADLIPIQARAKEEGMVRQDLSLGNVVRGFLPPQRFPDYYEPLEHRARLAIAV